MKEGKKSTKEETKDRNSGMMKGVARIEAENKRLGELYKVKQVLANGVEMPGTYIDMGIVKGEVYRKGINF
jgi:hypothetical protein